MGKGFMYAIATHGYLRISTNSINGGLQHSFFIPRGNFTHGKIINYRLQHTATLTEALTLLSK